MNSKTIMDLVLFATIGAVIVGLIGWVIPGIDFSQGFIGGAIIGAIISLAK